MLLIAGALAGWAGCGIQDSEDFDPEGGSPSGAGGSGAASGTTASTGSGADGAGGGYGQGGASTGTGPPLADTTPHEVACGSETCTVPEETCCIDNGSASCIRGGCPGTINRGSFSTVHCDDAADCNPGSICCVTSGSEVTLYECSKASECTGYESCIPNGVCSDGLTCVSNDDEVTGAKCVGESASISCGSTACAVGEICCNDQSLACVAAGSDCMHSYECDSASDCGPNASCCADGAGGSICLWSSCSGLTFCATDAECPGTACAVQPGLDVPDGYKVCN